MTGYSYTLTNGEKYFVQCGGFIDKRYIKCPHTSKACKWKMSKNHRKGHEYLNGACYLSGSFNFECPD